MKLCDGLDETSNWYFNLMKSYDILTFSYMLHVMESFGMKFEGSKLIEMVKKCKKLNTTWYKSHASIYMSDLWFKDTSHSKHQQLY